MICEDERIENLIFALITGSASVRSDMDIWDYEHGVKFFVGHFMRRNRIIWRHENINRVLIERYGRM